MSLLKTAWKLLIGVKDVLTLLFLLIFFGALYAALSFSPNPAVEARGGALLVTLDGTLVDQKADNDPIAVLTGQASPVHETLTRDVVRALRLAAKDSDIKAVVLDLDRFLGAGAVSLGEVGEALADVRKAGKTILSHATAYSDDSYALAAQANEVWLHPMGGVLIAGPGGSQPYFKGLLDRFDVNLHVYRVGKYKSYVEPYLLQAASAEAKEADQALVDALWEDWRTKVKAARPKADIASFAQDPVAALQAGGGDLAKAAQAKGLIDALGSDRDFGTRVAKIVGGDEDRGPGDFNSTSLDAYLAANPEDQGGDVVAVVHVAGEIVDGDAPDGVAAGDTVADRIDQAVQHLDAKALVLRVDSPGGSAMASEKIRQAALAAKKAGLPVIVSMGNVAASGGYWVAMAGDKVFAEPATITGSIGVFGLIPSFEKTLARYGVTSDGVKTTPLSGQPDVLGGINAEGDALIQGGISDIYRRFTGLVSASRKLPLARVEELAQGRVWIGGTAHQNKLIDAFGSLDDAVAEAARRAKLDPADISVVHVEPQTGWLQRLFEPAARVTAAEMRIGADPVSRLVALRQAQMGTALADARHVMDGPAVQVRCMNCPPVRLSAPAKPSTWFNRMFH